MSSVLFQDQCDLLDEIREATDEYRKMRQDMTELKKRICRLKRRQDRQRWLVHTLDDYVHLIDAARDANLSSVAVSERPRYCFRQWLRKHYYHLRLNFYDEEIDWHPRDSLDDTSSESSEGSKSSSTTSSSSDCDDCDSPSASE